MVLAAILFIRVVNPEEALLHRALAHALDRQRLVSQRDHARLILREVRVERDADHKAAGLLSHNIVQRELTALVLTEHLHPFVGREVSEQAQRLQERHRPEHLDLALGLFQTNPATLGQLRDTIAAVHSTRPSAS